MTEGRQEKICVFIDNCSLFAASHRLGLKLDYKRLKDWVVKQRNALVVRYYCGETPSEATQRTDYYSVLRRAGYEVMPVAVNYAYERLGNVALDPIVRAMCVVNMVMDMCDLIHSGHYDRFILITGSAEFSQAVTRIQQKGIEVEIVFTEEFCDPILKSKANCFRPLDLTAVSMLGSRSIDSLLKVGSQSGTEKSKFQSQM